MEIDGRDMPCECCGVTAKEAYEAGMARTFTATWSKDTEPMTYLCDFCEGLIDAGLLRREVQEGEVRYRQWHMGEWTPGELIGKPVTVRD